MLCFASLGLRYYIIIFLVFFQVRVTKMPKFKRKSHKVLDKPHFLCYDNAITVEEHFANSTSVSKVAQAVAEGKGAGAEGKRRARLCWSYGITSVGLSLLRRAILIFLC